MLLTKASIARLSYTIHDTGKMLLKLIWLMISVVWNKCLKITTDSYRPIAKLSSDLGILRFFLLMKVDFFEEGGMNSQNHWLHAGSVLGIQLQYYYLKILRYSKRAVTYSNGTVIQDFCDSFC